MLMNQSIVAIPTVCLCLLLTGGCSHKDAVVTKEPLESTHKADQAKIEPVKDEQQKVVAVAPLSSGKIVNAIAAVVNDEIITLNEVEQESQPLIREAEKKSPLDAATRSKLRHTALEHLIDKKILDQKVKELNIKVGDEEIKQAIDDVKKQNNMASQEVFVSALAGQGLTFEQYRSQLREQIEKLKLVSMEVRSKIQIG